MKSAGAISVFTTRRVHLLHRSIIGAGPQISVAPEHFHSYRNGYSAASRAAKLVVENNLISGHDLTRRGGLKNYFSVTDSYQGTTSVVSFAGRGWGTSDMDYSDSQVAEIYDAANPLAEDGFFYLALAGSTPCSVLDLGCGTGTLCCALAERGHEITAVDPARAMLDVARRKPHPNQVEWVEATAESYRSQKRFDLIFMTGHAFQTLLVDASILATFETMRVHLNGGGRVAF